jgi:hypothetical protein
VEYIVRLSWLTDDTMALRTLSRDQTSLRLLIGFTQRDEFEPDVLLLESLYETTDTATLGNGACACLCVCVCVFVCVSECVCVCVCLCV